MKRCFGFHKWTDWFYPVGWSSGAVRYLPSVPTMGGRTLANLLRIRGNRVKRGSE